jgi:hypothetical protein
MSTKHKGGCPPLGRRKNGRKNTSLGKTEEKGGENQKGYHHCG